MNNNLLMLLQYIYKILFENVLIYRSGRYHQTESISAYYSHLIPGVISPSLRYALGLSDGDLPPYVYRLRKHGYPKAWLKHATVKPSGINLYDTYGNSKKIYLERIVLFIILIISKLIALSKCYLKPSFSALILFI